MIPIMTTKEPIYINYSHIFILTQYDFNYKDWYSLSDEIKYGDNVLTSCIIISRRILNYLNYSILKTGIIL